MPSVEKTFYKLISSVTDRYKLKYNIKFYAISDQVIICKRHILCNWQSILIVINYIKLLVQNIYMNYIKLLV